MNKLYTAQEVADKLKIKKTTVYELIKRRELSSSKIGKQLRVSDEQLKAYLDSTVQSGASLIHDYQPESSLLKRDYLLHSSGLIISGQSSPALDLLLNQLPAQPGSLPVLQSHLNTYNGLYSLYFEKVHIACAAASFEDIQSLVPGIPLTVLHFYSYEIGFYIKKGNPRNIQGFPDLQRADIIFANREKGSSRRVYLDRQLNKLGISPENISGYRNELVSDSSTAAAVAGGQADVALGEAYAARTFAFKLGQSLSMLIFTAVSTIGAGNGTGYRIAAFGAAVFCCVGGIILMFYNEKRINGIITKAKR